MRSGVGTPRKSAVRRNGRGVAAGSDGHGSAVPLRSAVRALISVAVTSLLLLSGSAQTGRAQSGGPQGGDFSRNVEAKKLPTGVILVKGAWSSASDSVTPLPESGSVSDNVYSNRYFGLSYALEADWIQKYSGPPPSDSGYYVLAQIRPADASKDANRASILISAQDMFFTVTPTTNALDLIEYTSENLEPDYKVEEAPTPVQIASHLFVRFDYGSPVADLHWHILATQIRCHTVQFVFTSRDTKFVEGLIRDMSTMKLTSSASAAGGIGGGDVPVCVKDYASDENVMERLDPVLTERRFNSIPVRVTIDKQGKVKHIHFLSAFPDQAKVITDALLQWRFRPYLLDGQATEVETGIMFGRAPRQINSVVSSGVNE